MTADALPRPAPRGAWGTPARIAAGVLAATALVLGGLALRAAAPAAEGATLTVAQLDGALGITVAGSRELDEVPDAVLQAALDREARDAAVVAASGVPIGSPQRLRVQFTAADRGAAKRLTTLLTRASRFTVTLSAPSSRHPHWTIAAVTPTAPLSTPLAHQLTERMSEAAARTPGTTFDGWRVAGR